MDVSYSVIDCLGYLVMSSILGGGFVVFNLVCGRDDQCDYCGGVFSFVFVSLSLEIFVCDRVLFLYVKGDLRGI